MRLYHGTTREALAAARAGGWGGDVYLTPARGEALGYAEGRHLGGSAGRPVAAPVTAAPGRTLLAHGELDDAVAAGEDPSEALEGILRRARGLGYRYVRYLHPSFSGRGQQVVYVSLRPDEDLRLGWAPARGRGAGRR